MSTESENPYAPPQAVLVAEKPAGDLGDYDDAGQGKRFLNFLVDRAVNYGLTFPVGFAIGLLYEAGFHAPYDLLIATGVVGDYIFAYLLAVTYYIVMEGLFGLTLGKLITGTRVVDQTGKKPSWGTIVGRSFARIVPFEPFSFLGNRRGWHDEWSDTRVVDIRGAAVKLSPGLRKLYDRS